MAFTGANRARQGKRPVETILVADGNSALPAGGTVLYNASTGVTNLSDGQIGIFDVSGEGTNARNTALSAGDTYTDSPVIRFYQGTPNSNNPAAAKQYPREARVYEASEPIHAHTIKAYTGKAYAAPTHSAWLIGANPAGTTLRIADVVADLTNFKLNIAFRGRQVDEFNSSMHGIPRISVEFTTPDYTTLGTTNPTDHLIENLVYKINRNSSLFNYGAPSFGAGQPLVAFAIDADGSGTGTAISAISAGTVVNTVTSAGTTYSVTFTQAMVDTLADLVANTYLTTSSEIQVVDITTAGTAAVGAGSDCFIIMALDYEQAVVDRNPFVKIRLDVGLELGWTNDTCTLVEGSYPFEGQGTYRQWKIYYDNTAGQRKYSQNRDLYPVVEYWSPFGATTDTYDAYIIEYGTENGLTFDTISRSPHKLIILVEPGDTTTTASLEAVLNPWMQSQGINAVNL